MGDLHHPHEMADGLVYHRDPQKEDGSVCHRDPQMADGSVYLRDPQMEDGSVDLHHRHEMVDGLAYPHDPRKMAYPRRDPRTVCDKAADLPRGRRAHQDGWRHLDPRHHHKADAQDGLLDRQTAYDGADDLQCPAHGRRSGRDA